MGSRTYLATGKRWRLTIIVALLVALIPVVPVNAAPPANQYFQRTWARTDGPVADQLVNRTWMWGPEAFTGAMQETFVDSPGGLRTVQYFDKSRMEISDVGEDPSSIWYVTNGLLVVEMMTGSIQIGLNAYQGANPANVNVAGDADDRLGATYRYFGALRHLSPKAEGSLIREVVSPGSAGNLFMFNDRYLTYGVTASHFVPETNHTVASPFWDFMNTTGAVNENGSTVNAQLFVNPFYATGYPVTEAYWANVRVAGVPTDVLIQCFERRCLTYTPSNPAGWRVEAGNVGRHYFEWRTVEFANPPVGNAPPGYVLPPGSPGPTPPSANSESNYQLIATWSRTNDVPVVDIDVDVWGNVYTLVGFINPRLEVHNRNGALLRALQLPTGSGQPNYSGLHVVSGNSQNHAFVLLIGKVFVYGSALVQVYEFGGVGSSYKGYFEIDSSYGGYPNSVAVDSHGNFYIGMDSAGVFKYSPTWSLVGIWNTTWPQLGGRTEVALDRNRNLVYVADYYNNRLVVFSTNGEFLGSMDGFNGPHDVAVGSDGVTYVAERGGERISVIRLDGTVVTFGGASLNIPRRIAVDGQGTIYVVDVDGVKVFAKQ